MGAIDLSRSATNFRKHFTSVRAQMGRVLTDDDHNDNERIHGEDERRSRIHIVGPAGSPDDGFRIQNPTVAANGKINFDILSGTFYLGGNRLDLEQTEQFQAQSDWVNMTAADIPAPPTSGSRYDLVYLECWLQAVSAVEDSELFETALGGPDTSVRMRLMRRVHAFAGSAIGDCHQDWATLTAQWTAAGLGRLSAQDELVVDTLLQIGFGPGSDTKDLCAPPVSGGYLGAENQAIRVQLVDASSFTWGFDNAAPLYRVKVGPNNVGQIRKVTLLTEPKDQAHWPIAGQVVELLPWSAVLANNEKAAEVSGFLAKVDVSYNPDTRELFLASDVPTGFVNPDFLYMRIWNRGSDTTSPASISFTNGTAVPLGNTGLTVTFTGNHHHPADYWIIAARPESPNRVVPWLLETGRGPHGIRRYYVPLAVIQWTLSGSVATGKVIHDCREKFFPLAIPAVHVTGINWSNDDLLALAPLKNNGLKVTFDLPPDPQSISNSTMIVTVEHPPLAGGFARVLPRPVVGAPQAETMARLLEAVPPPGSPLENLRELGLTFERFAALAGAVAITPPEPLVLVSLIITGQLSVTSGVVTWTSQIRVDNFISLLSTSESGMLRCRVALKGRDVWWKLGNEMLYLDGQVFGRPAVRADGSTPRTDLMLPSGHGERASDFESWFWLVLIPLRRKDYEIGGYIGLYDRQAMIAGDFYGGGKVDLAVIHWRFTGLPTIALLRGQGDGTFQYATDAAAGPGGFAVSLVAGDFDSDGKVDLAIADWGNLGVRILLGNGDGTFRLGAVYNYPSAPYSLVTGDFNGDNKLDLAVANFNSNVSVLLGNGDGTFRAPVGYPVGRGALAIVAGDFDANGNVDLVTANNAGVNTTGSISVLLGNGNGTFQTHLDYPAGIEPVAVATGDFDGDGNLDLAVVNNKSFATSSNGSISILQNDGSGKFTVKTTLEIGAAPTSIIVADLDGDGKLDLAVANGADGVSVLLGNGDFTFQSPVPYPTGDFPMSVVSADFDHDGSADLAVANFLGTVSVFLNRPS